MKQFSFYWPGKDVSTLLLVMKARGFSKVSEYIRDLVLKDSRNYSMRGSASINGDLKRQLDRVECLLECKTNEILQRNYILTKLILDQMAKSGNKNFTPENLQQIVNVFIEEAQKRYPVK